MPSDLSAPLVDAHDFLKKEFGLKAVEIFRDPLCACLSGLFGSALERFGLAGASTRREADRRNAPRVDFPDDGYSTNKNVDEVVESYFKELSSLVDDGRLASEILFASSEKSRHATSLFLCCGSICFVSVLIQSATPPLCRRKYRGLPYLAVKFSVPTGIPDIRSKEHLFPMLGYRAFFPLPPPEKAASALNRLVREMHTVFRPFFSERERLLPAVKELSTEYAKRLKIIEVGDAGIRAVAEKIASDLGRKVNVECGIDEFRVCSPLGGGKAAVALVPRGFSDFAPFSEEFGRFVLTGRASLEGVEFGVADGEDE